MASMAVAGVGELAARSSQPQKNFDRFIKSFVVFSKALGGVVSENRVRSELTRVEADLAEAQIEQATLTARIEGLKAQQAALRQALAADNDHHVGKEEIMRMKKADAIVAVVDRPMRIDDVVQALRAAGRDQEAYMPVSIYLADLVKYGRLKRTSHGVYGPV
jgi:capsule polysaccharide export protein KpsE/RkpR